ncbi:hypothetical protein L7F22_054947 [Adiantum nelumboides]|nr:hypothetical protein [Adiantum nelumboides]
MAANQTESVGRTSIQAMEISAPGGSRPEAEATSRLTYSNLLQQWINSRWGEARPSSHLSSGSTANSSAPIYSRLFSIAESIGSSVYSNSGLSRVLSQPSSHGSSIPRPPSAVQIYENHLDTVRFYDELVMRAISFGVIQADDFGYFGFSYKMLGSEYARIIQPEAVVKNHRKLIEYLYRHRLGQDFLLIFLDKGDAFVQQAALNMPGFWADPSKRIRLEEVKITKRVLSKMADKVGEGQVGWAATNSFGGIARRDLRILAETRTSDGVPLLERLAELVNGRSSSSLNYVRTLALFYHYSYKKEQIVPALLQGRELVRKLKQLLEGASVQRARLFAAYLLHLMGQLDEGSYDAVFAINPTKGRDTYWFKGELDLLNFIRKQCNVNVKEVQPDDVPEGFLRTDDNRCPNGIAYL